MTMAGNLPAFFLPVSVQGKRMSPQAPLLPGHAGHGPVVFIYVTVVPYAGCAVPPS